MSEWQPIETAPKDGTRIIVKCKDGEVIVAEWKGVAFAYPKSRPIYEWYVPYSDQDEQGGAYDVNPVEWQELPK